MPRAGGQHLSHELLGRHSRQRPVELQDDGVLHPEL
jgi:hypothetical protein